MDTAWGRPRSNIVIGEADGVRAAFLPRHGRGHFILPHEINFRANIAALKMLGVDGIYAFSAVGSLQERVRPLNSSCPPGYRPDQVQCRHVLRRRRGGAYRLRASVRGAPARTSWHRSRSNRVSTMHIDGTRSSAWKGPPFPRGPRASSTLLGRRPHQHERGPRGQARPRGGDLLLHGLHVHRLRLLEEDNST